VLVRFRTALALLEEQRLVVDLGEARVEFARALRDLGQIEGALTEFKRAREVFARMDATGILAEIDRDLAAIARETTGITRPSGSREELSSQRKSTGPECRPPSILRAPAVARANSGQASVADGAEVALSAARAEDRRAVRLCGVVPLLLVYVWLTVQSPPPVVLHLPS